MFVLLKNNQLALQWLAKRKNTDSYLSEYVKVFNTQSKAKLEYLKEQKTTFIDFI